MPKSNLRTFGTLVTGDLFVTGPADTLFVRVNGKSTAYDSIYGMAICLEDGKEIMIPASRQVTMPKKKHFTILADRYWWNKQRGGTTPSRG